MIYSTVFFFNVFSFGVFPQQQNAMGSLHNIDFGGRAGAVPGRNRVPGTGSGNWFREPPGFDGFRHGSDRFCGSKVPVQKVA